MSKKSRTCEPAEKDSAPVETQFVYGFHGVGDFLGVSYLTVWRWSKKDPSFAKVLRVYRKTPLGNGKWRSYILAAKEDLLAWAKSKPWLFDVLPGRGR